MKKNKFVILSICLLVGLCGSIGVKETPLGSKSETQQIVSIDNNQYALNLDNEYQVKEINEIYTNETNKDIEILNEDEVDEDTESSEDIPFSTSLGFQWWWIVIIIGSIALIFFIAWLIFFIWDRKDKKKYKKKQQK